MTNEEIAALLTKLDGEATPGPVEVLYFSGQPTEISAVNVKIGGPAKLFDVRGWGYLTGKGHGALGLPAPEAIAIQKATAELFATYRNHHQTLVAGLAALGEVERLTRALQAIDRHNDNPRHYDSYVNDLIQAALQPAKEPTP